MEEEEKKEQTETEEAKEKSFMEWCKAHPKTVFAIRVFLWATFAAILPFAFIAWRYGIFTSECKIQLSGWGFIAVIVLIVFVSTLIRYVYKGLKPGFAKQCVFGLVSIILPLIMLYLLIDSIENSIQIFKQALCCVILCETISIPLNPFPSWIAKRQTNDEQKKAENMADVFWEKFFNKKKDNE